MSRRDSARTDGRDQSRSTEATPRSRLEYEARAHAAWVRCKKKRRRPLESQRADVAFKRTHFAIKIRRIPFERLVFLDESGLNLAMSRSHAWVKRGTEFIDRVPMNWGKNLTLLGAIRRDGWVVLTTTYEKATKDRFVWWLRTKLLPKLRLRRRPRHGQPRGPSR